MKFRNLVPFLISALIVIGTTPIRYSSLRADLWISFLVHFAVFSILLNRTPANPKQMLLSYLAAPVVLFSVDLIIPGESLHEKIIHTGWPNVLPHIVAPLFAYWFHSSKMFARIAIGGFALVVYLANIFWVAEKWDHFRNWRSFSNEVSERIPAGWVAISTTGNKLSCDSLNGKLVLLDFWNSGCPACIRSFPVLDSIFQATKSDARVRINSVFVPYRKNDTPGYAEMILARRKMSFPVVMGRGLDTVFGIYTYPTVLLIYNDRIIHRGDLKTAIAKLTNLLDNNHQSMKR